MGRDRTRPRADVGIELGAVSDVGIELERDAGDLDVVAGLKALGLERAQHADPAQPALEVR